MAVCTECVNYVNILMHLTVLMETLAHCLFDKSHYERNRTDLISSMHRLPNRNLHAFHVFPAFQRRNMCDVIVEQGTKQFQVEWFQSNRIRWHDLYFVIEHYFKPRPGLDEKFQFNDIQREQPSIFWDWHTYLKLCTSSNYCAESGIKAIHNDYPKALRNHMSIERGFLAF